MNYESFTRLWTKAQPVVSNYVHAMVLNFHDAEDLLQDVAVIVMRKFEQYDSSQPFNAWAMGIAKLEIIYRRRQGAHAPGKIPIETMDKLAALYEQMAPELEARTEALRRCYQQLQGRARELVKLRYEQAQKPGDIAIQLKMDSGAVRVALNRVRSILQECVERNVAMEKHT
jgi:RNA polymerase sigma-70 factor, ECF subfamily